MCIRDRLMVKGTGLTPVQRIIKRAMDLVLCGIAMIHGAFEDVYKRQCRCCWHCSCHR